MKKIISLVVMVAILLTMSISLIGCGGGSIDAFQVPEGGYDGSDVTIKFYHTMGDNLQEVLIPGIEEFNKLYPNITVEWESVGGYDDVRDTISTEIPAGNQPHIAYCYPDHVALYNIAGAVAPMDNLIASDIEITRADDTTEVLGLTQEQKDDFIEGYYNEGKQFGDDLMYTLPFSKSTEVLYYNKTFFDANDLTVPTTWDEMEEVCADIKKIDPQSIPLGIDSENNWFITMAEQYGSPYTSATGDKYIFDNEVNRGFVEEFRGWYDKGYITTKEIYGAYTSGLFVETEEETRSYMSIGSSAGATHQCPKMTADGKYPFDVAITSIPQVDPDAPKVISQGPSLTIFNKTNPQEVVASWLFVKYLTTTPEFQAEFSMASGYAPVIKSVQENEVYAEFVKGANGGSNIAALSAKVALEQADAYYTSPAFNGSSVARDQVGIIMQTAFVQKPAEGETVEDMIKKIFEEAVEECVYRG